MTPKARSTCMCASRPIVAAPNTVKRERYPANHLVRICDVRCDQVAAVRISALPGDMNQGVLVVLGRFIGECCRTKLSSLSARRSPLFNRVSRDSAFMECSHAAGIDLLTLLQRHQGAYLRFDQEQRAEETEHRGRFYPRRLVWRLHSSSWRSRARWRRSDLRARSACRSPCCPRLPCARAFREGEFRDVCQPSRPSAWGPTSFTPEVPPGARRRAGVTCHLYQPCR